MSEPILQGVCTQTQGRDGNYSVHCGRVHRLETLGVSPGSGYFVPIIVIFVFRNIPTTLLVPFFTCISWHVSWILLHSWIFYVRPEEV